jgi:hypothetical protein
MIDPDLHLAKTLVIEPNPMLRSVTAGQLRSGGVGEVAGEFSVSHAGSLPAKGTGGKGGGKRINADGWP